MLSTIVPSICKFYRVRTKPLLVSPTVDLPPTVLVKVVPQQVARHETTKYYSVLLVLVLRIGHPEQSAVHNTPH